MKTASFTFSIPGNRLLVGNPSRVSQPLEQNLLSRVPVLVCFARSFYVQPTISSRSKSVN